MDNLNFIIMEETGDIQLDLVLNINFCRFFPIFIPVLVQKFIKLHQLINKISNI